MVKDSQVRRLFMLIKKEKSLAMAAIKSGMDEETARKYRDKGKLPSQMKKPHNWRTRVDPFKEVWVEVLEYLSNPGIEALTIFKYLQRKYPGKYQDGQLRTLQRKIKSWKATEGPPKEVYFRQIHHPGELCETDFTSMNKLGITINKEIFKHMFFHFVLTYSNWETGTICYSESFESLSEGIQNALWELGGVPKRHRTDNLSAAVYSDFSKKSFTSRYKALLNHYGLHGESINAGKSNENGDIEQRHNRFKRSVEQALMLRGSKDFSDIKEYKKFLDKIITQLNSGRTVRFKEELSILRRLPNMRLDDYKEITAKVGIGSTLNISHNVYSVDSRLIGERVRVKLYSSFIEIWYSQKMVDKFPRLRGGGGHKINYRHIIDWLAKKPGAFENYRYRDDLFPTTWFRIAYDVFKEDKGINANKEYTKLLLLASKETEEGVNDAIRILHEENKPVSFESVKEILNKREKYSSVKDVKVEEVKLCAYDELISISSAIGQIGNGVKLNERYNY